MKPASEIIKAYQVQHPDKRFAITPNVLGVWIDSENQYIPFASCTLTGEWVYMPLDILVDGHKIERNWIPV